MFRFNWKKIFSWGKKNAANEIIEIFNSKECANKVRDEIKKKLVDAANKKINIPGMTEAQEEALFGAAYDALRTVGIGLIRTRIGK